MLEIGLSPVLAGAAGGQAALARMLERIRGEVTRPEPLFIDFGHIDVATASYLRESVLAFRAYVRDHRPTYYPVIANTNVAVRDEFAVLMQARREVTIQCRLSDGGDVSDVTLLGDLEPKQKVTFELVNQYGDTDAAELMRDHGNSEGVTRPTAWNNRLSSLANLGLIVEESNGRAKRYRPLFKRA